MSGGSERAVAWRRGTHALVCGRLEPWAHGTVARAPDVADYYDYNLARVEDGDPGLGAEALAAAAEPALAGLAHRRVEVEDEAAGARLAPGFAAMGWIVERLAFLHRELPGPDAEPPAGAELRVDAFEASRGLRRSWQGETVWNEPPAFALVEEVVAARRGTRAVVGRIEGQPAGFAAFSVAGDTAEVELVFCLPAHRGAGLGGALVARALAEAHAAGARHALIEADDTGDAKRLYERLGFRTVWRRSSFTRRPADAQA